MVNHGMDPLASQFWGFLCHRQRRHWRGRMAEKQRGQVVKVLLHCMVSQGGEAREDGQHRVRRLVMIKRRVTSLDTRQKTAPCFIGSWQRKSLQRLQRLVKWCYVSLERLQESYQISKPSQMMSDALVELLLFRTGLEPHRVARMQIMDQMDLFI